MGWPPPSEPFLVRAARIMGRALLLRCPNCGAKDIRQSWFRLAAHCHSCRLSLERAEPGYRVGAYMFNIIAAELVFAAIFIGVVLATWPDPPWNRLMYGGAGLMVVLPILFYPLSQTLFLGFHLMFHQPERHEFE